MNAANENCADASGHPERQQDSAVAERAPEAPQKWSPFKRDVFRLIDAHAICVVATDGPVSVTLWSENKVIRRIGHNRGVWPAKVAKASAWRDQVSLAYDRNPFFFIGTQFRVWTLGEAARDRLALAATEHMGVRSEAEGGLDELMHGFVDLGEGLDFPLFELEIHDMAARWGMQVWDDAGLSGFVDRIGARADAIRRDAGLLLLPAIERALGELGQGELF